MICPLGACFPSLRHLGLAECPISSIPESAYLNFENLQSLTISNTAIEDMTDIARLKKFNNLTDLRLQGIPLFTEMTGKPALLLRCQQLTFLCLLFVLIITTAHERRQLLVALLPNVKKLNGGAKIANTEREDAERAFIRRFVQEEGDKPER